ncbi:hypothetical protein K402DRAFT_396756 [Aulographum hederae CBS 113979]|uniref:PRELI/MSF1 domain-containing protein n=1 Tax=Aulographum hederae CBS 113979 TaxID=1176131 RepID=A0A6G1GR87_9PEZI|nr:hypothetical protein K402DRAFT_396756 [Aulographum hederae CBS 113979]
MVKFYTSNHTYDSPLPTVSLAYFLRYPNPYSKHVISTDTISRSFSADDQTLTTVRLHLKRSKLPQPILKLLPRSMTGASATGESKSYILETSTVDMRNGTMATESRNLEWVGVLSVIERQVYRGVRPGQFSDPPSSVSDFTIKEPTATYFESGGSTEVQTTVTLRSPFGEQRWRARADRNKSKSATAAEAEEEAPKQSFFKSWSTQSLQRSIELIGLKRAQTSQPNAKEGMKVVLERLRSGGLVAVLEGMRRDSKGAWGKRMVAAGGEEYEE